MSYIPSAPYDPSEGCDPCPFCGVPAKIYRKGGGPGWGVSHYPENGCPIAVYEFYKATFETREAAVEAWNRRKPVPLPACVLPLDHWVKKRD